MQRIVPGLLFAIVATLSTGCVTLGEHEALQKEYADTKSRLVEERDSLRRALDEEKARAEQLSTKLRELAASLEQRSAELEAKEQEIASLGTKNTDLEAQLAAMVKDKSRLSASVDEMQSALAELGKRKAEADRRIAEYRGLLARFQALIDAGKLKVKIVDGRMVVALATDILFPSGSAHLSKDGKAAIEEVAQILTSIPDRKYQVEGHTDNVPIRTAQYPSNWELASARALTVVKAMVEAGMPADRLSAASFGEHKPAASNETKEGRDANRRIEIVVVPDLSSLPGFDELKQVSGS